MSNSVYFPLVKTTSILRAQNFIIRCGTPEISSAWGIQINQHVKKFIGDCTDALGRLAVTNYVIPVTPHIARNQSSIIQENIPTAHINTHRMGALRFYWLIAIG